MRKLTAEEKAPHWRCTRLCEAQALIIYESIIDDERRQNACGLLMSLNMLIETEGGFDLGCEEPTNDGAVP
jgi:hypothetical protein